MGTGKQVSRRDVLRTLGLIAAGAAAAACTPLRILTQSYPDDFKHGADKAERALRAFVLTVVPGAPADSPDLARALLDRAYPFAPYAAFFAADLCARATARYAAPFWSLAPAERTQIVSDGLTADATTRKLYRGAVFLTQVSFFGGIYDDEAGCPLIEFAGRYRGEAVTYRDAERFLPPPSTPAGNYA